MFNTSLAYQFFDFHNVLQIRLENVLMTFEDISQDDLKKSFKIFSRHLGRQKQLRWSRLQDGWKKCLEDGWKICLEDGWKTCLESVLKKSWRHLWDKRNVLLRISVFNHSLLTNLNQYVANLYLTNLYFTNLRRIQNALIRTW